MSGALLNSPEFLVEVVHSLFSLSELSINSLQLLCEQLHFVGTNAFGFVAVSLEELELSLNGLKSLNFNINFVHSLLVSSLFLGMSGFLSLSESQVANLGEHSEEGVEVDVLVNLSFVGDLLVDLSLFGLSALSSNLLHHSLNSFLLEVQMFNSADVSVQFVDSLEELLSVLNESSIRSAGDELGQGVKQEDTNFLVTIVTHSFGDLGELISSDTLEFFENLLEKTLFDFLQIRDVLSLSLGLFLEVSLQVLLSINIGGSILVFGFNLIHKY